MLDPQQLANRLQFARAAALEAGRHTLKYFQNENFVVEVKGDLSPVTIADREAEQLLRRRIRESFPADAILGEEFGEQPGTSGYRWILDPIDGTKSFISGVPLYSTLVGLEFEEVAVLGVIEIPALDERVWAARGHGAWHGVGNREPVAARVSLKTSLADSVFLTSDGKTFEKVGRSDVFDRFQSRARIARTWGDGYGYLLVATGRAEVMVDPAMNAWDAAPLLPILLEAGGCFTDWEGRETIHGGNSLACNKALYAEAKALLMP